MRVVFRWAPLFVFFAVGGQYVCASSTATETHIGGCWRGRETSMHRCLLYVQTVTFTHPEKSPVASRQRPVRSRARASLDVARFGTSNHLCERTTTDEL